MSQQPRKFKTMITTSTNSSDSLDTSTVNLSDTNNPMMYSTISGGSVHNPSAPDTPGPQGSPGLNSNDNNATIPKLTLDEAISLIPIGIFHLRLLTLCGLSFCADAMEVSLLAFMSVCAGVEWHLSNAVIASITAAVFVGQFFGGLFWGPVADHIGRRKSFVAIITIISCAGVISGFSPDYQSLILFRFICGFGVGGLTVPFDLLAEFMPNDIRGAYLMKMEYFWCAGSMFVTGVAWLVLSQYGWRTLTFITAIPVILVSAISYFYLPESPRWLMEKGRVRDAERVIKDAIILAGGEQCQFVLVDASIHAPASNAGYGGTMGTDLAVMEGGNDDNHNIERESNGDGDGDDEMSTIDFGNNSNNTSTEKGTTTTTTTKGAYPGTATGNKGISTTTTTTNESSVEPQRGPRRMDNGIPTAATTTSFVDMVKMHYNMYSVLLQPHNVGYSYILWWAWFT